MASDFQGTHFTFQHDESVLRKELLKLSKNKLAKRCKILKLSTLGTKADLVNKILYKHRKTLRRLEHPLSPTNENDLMSPQSVLSDGGNRRSGLGLSPKKKLKIRVNTKHKTAYSGVSSIHRSQSMKERRAKTNYFGIHKKRSKEKKKKKHRKKKKRIKSKVKRLRSKHRKKFSVDDMDGEVFGAPLRFFSPTVDSPVAGYNQWAETLSLDTNIRLEFLRSLSDNDGSLSDLDDDGVMRLTKPTKKLLEQMKQVKVHDLQKLNDDEMLLMAKNGCTPRRLHRFSRKNAHMKPIKTYSFDEDDSDEEISTFAIHNNPDYVQHIVTCGYLREFQENHLLFDEFQENFKTITKMIQLYCTVYQIFGTGENRMSSLGLGHEKQVLNFKRLHGLEELIPHFDHIYCNASNIIARTLDNEMYACGCAWNAQLGVDKLSLSEMTNIYCEHGAIDVISRGKSNEFHTFVYTNRGHLFASGINTRGQFGNGERADADDRQCFMRIRAYKMLKQQIMAIECGKTHTLFLTDQGNVFCCGNNFFGQCGKDHTFDSYILRPTLFKYNDGKERKILAISCGRNHNIMIDDSNDLITFGSNRFGQCGIDNTSADDNKFKVCKATVNEYMKQRGLGVVHIACGEVHSLVIADNGEAYVFGINNYGQIGNNTVDRMSDVYVGRWKPDKVRSIYINEDIVFIDGACGTHHNVMLSNQRQIVVWGDNGCGQCGYQIEMAPMVTAPSELDKGISFQLAHNAYVEKVLALHNETIVIFNPNRVFEIPQKV